MDKSRINIAIIEPSDIIYIGLFTQLMKADNNFYIYRINDLSDIDQITITKNITAFVINPIAIQNRSAEFNQIKAKHEGSTWIALLTTLLPCVTINSFDSTFSIYDNISTLCSNIINSSRSEQDNSALELSEREKQILIYLTKGMSAREIGDILQISANTVTTHRKNITEKTGIKTISGLTIYALSQNLIPMDYSLL